MRFKSFFAMSLASICLLSNLPAFPCGTHRLQTAAPETKHASSAVPVISYAFPNNGYAQTIFISGVTTFGKKDGIPSDLLEAALLKQAGCSAMTQDDYMKILSGTNRQLSKRTAQQILDKAVAMKNIRWTPSQTLIGYKGETTFDANIPQDGIPYSPLTQVDDIDFLEKLANADDFYENDTMDGETCPRYGVDAAGYVCFAFDIKHLTTEEMIDTLKKGVDLKSEIVKVGSYDPNSLEKEDLYAAYELLLPGDAAAFSKVTEENSTGHAILILDNDPSSEQIVVYEIKDTVPIVSIYTYSELWDDQYMPFRRK